MWLGGLVTITLSIMLGTFILSIVTMFDFISDHEEVQKTVEISTVTSTVHNLDIEAIPENKVNRMPQAMAILFHDKEHGSDFDTSVNAWDDNGDTGNNENEIPEKNNITDEPLSAEQHEIQMLHEALPENRLIPINRSKQELERTIESIEEEQYIQTLINNKEATAGDLQRYYDLQARQFEDEIALIDFCQKVVAEEHSAYDVAHPFCASVVLDGEAKRMANEESLEQLRQHYL